MRTVDIRLDADERDALLAALSFYREFGFGKRMGLSSSSVQPGWVQDLACPDGNSTPLYGKGLIDLFARLLHSRGAVMFADQPLSSLAETARRRELQFFVVPGSAALGIPVVTFHKEMQEADDRAGLVDGVVYSTTATGVEFRRHGPDAH